MGAAVSTAAQAVRNKPSIEWPAPQVNDAQGALDDVSCLIERLYALMKQNIDEMQDAVINRPVADEFQSRWINDVWMIFRLAAEKLDEIDKTVTAIIDAGQFMPPSSIARHTRLRRSQDWRAAVDALDAANGSPDTSDEAIAEAGDAYIQVREARIASIEQFREKLEILAAADGGLDPADTRELLRDLDALGCRAQRAVAA